MTLQRRSRSIVTFGQFGGSACREPLGEWNECTPSETCVQQPPSVCTDNEFQCNSGTSATPHNMWNCVILGVMPVLLQALASSSYFIATGTVTVRTSQTNSAKSLCISPVVLRPLKMMSRGEQRDMGKRDKFKSLWLADKEADPTRVTLSPRNLW